MSHQDKATTERHARTLRELVKRPGNKFCADCKRNDPRWASWNIGVFLCIRCSGVHRGMGTHISKVKSVDLDTWTPVQMESIQKWGNRRANLYWEAHLKPGHVPPEHKVESFIRSKYESRRWVMEGPPPTDPSVLESGLPQEVVASTPQTQSDVAPVKPTRTSTNSLSSSSTGLKTQQPQLLSTNFTKPASSQIATSSPVQTTQAPTAQDELFTLDFHAPPPVTASNVAFEQPKKDVKQDILSLFSSAPSNPTPSQLNSGLWNSQPQPQFQQHIQPVSMIGNAGAGAWGTSSGWAPSAPVPPAQSNVWGASAGTAANTLQGDLFNTNDIWGGTGGTSTAAKSSSTPQKKDDVFGDLWGSLK